MQKLFLHLHVTRRDIKGHVTSLLQVKMFILFISVIHVNPEEQHCPVEAPANLNFTLLNFFCIITFILQKTATEMQLVFVFFLFQCA